MKLAFSTLACEGWTPEKMLEYCMLYGYKGIELRESDNSWVSVNLARNERIRIRELFKNAKIDVTNIGSNICVNGNDATELEIAFEDIKTLVLLAQDLSAQGIRIFLGNFYTSRCDAKPTVNYLAVIDWLKKACDFANDYGIQIWIETHNEFSTGKILAKVLSDVHRKNCNIVWDIIHPIEEHEQPCVTMSLLNERCAHVHIKDGKPFDDPMMISWKYTRIGEGVLPIKEIVDLLHANNYKGYLSLEWEYKWRNELRFPNSDAESILPVYANYMKRGDLNENLC